MLKVEHLHFADNMGYYLYIRGLFQAGEGAAKGVTGADLNIHVFVNFLEQGVQITGTIQDISKKAGVFT